MLALQSSASSSHAPTDPLSDSSKVHAVPNDAVSLYFSIFDIDDSGFIELSDFKLALACLLDSTTFSHHHITPSSPPSRALHHPLAVLSSRDNNSAYVDDVSGAGDVGAPRTRSARVRCMSFAHAKYLDDGQVEELFHTIDVDATGRISLHEFKKFYDTVIVTSSDSSTIRSGNSLLRPSGFD